MQEECPLSCIWKNGTEVTMIPIKNILGNHSARAVVVRTWVRVHCDSHLQPTCLVASAPQKPRRSGNVQSLAAVFTSYFLFPRYHLKDVIVGKIYFLLVRIKIKHMEIDIIKRETTGTGPNVYHENDTIAKYEIMDGAPVRGEHPGTQPTAASPVPPGPAQSFGGAKGLYS